MQKKDEFKNKFLHLAKQVEKNKMVHNYSAVCHYSRCFQGSSQKFTSNGK